MGQKGSVLVTAVLTISLLTALAIGWYYYRRLGSPINYVGGLPLPFVENRKQADTTGWPKLSPPGQSLSIYFPPGWYVIDDRYISQYPYTPGKDSNDIYNVITYSKITDQIQPGYTNDGWIAEIYRADPQKVMTNAYYSSNAVRLWKLESGRTQQGAKYVIFEREGQEHRRYSYVKRGQTIYEFSLANFDSTGERVFRTVIYSSLLD